MKIVYGPVASWRLGRSLGIDLICSSNKICSLNCIYCQLGTPEKITTNREKFISLKKLRNELKHALDKSNPDVITLSGMGEPSLANNLAESIKIIQEVTYLPIAILTNSTLLFKKEVRDILSSIDIIVAKLDASNQSIFKKINQPAEELTFRKNLDGIIKMRNRFKGKFALQIMFLNENKEYAHQLADLAREIKPDEVQINTPTRPCEVIPLQKNEMKKIEEMFHGLETISVYTSKKPSTIPLDKIELIKRRRMEV
jgi:wyosine [tRNA(Phe)-imidazoG37] synthetase (radical SAM superfamily)